jgi:CheY-like chemotaxis protein
MGRAVLIHWKPEEAAARLEALSAVGFDAVLLTPDGMPALRALRDNPPDVFVIDLSRLPSHGREIAAALRRQKATRHTPIVFAGGAPVKVEKVRRLLPDAVYTEWDGIRGALARALNNPPARPAAPAAMAGYSGTPLPKKLGIKPGMTVLLLGAPEGFEESLGEGARFTRRAADAGLALLFATSRAELEARFAAASRSCDSIWMIWPKKTSGVKGDLTQAAVREFGLALGWVDYKVCAVNATWSGLKFARRKA